jgi:pimeloyl-ACP methyl ester carboxylesterase
MFNIKLDLEMKTSLICLVLIATISLSIGCNHKGKTRLTTPDTKTVEIDGPVGKLKAILQIPKVSTDKKCPLVILMHGFMSSKNDPLITAVANQLQTNGIASIRFDFDGHGESDGEFVKMTVPLEVQDALAIFEYAKKLNFVSDINLLGHSQGGVVASLAGGELKESVKSIVLMAPAAVLVDDAKKGTIMGITYDPVDVPEYVSVYNHKLGRDYILSAQKLDIFGKAAGFKGAVCLIHGKADRVVPFSYSERYNEIYNNSTLHLFENENHMFSVNTELAVKTGVNFFKDQNRTSSGN